MSTMPFPVVELMICTSLAWLLWWLASFYFSKSSLDIVPGPQRESFWTGNMLSLFDRRTGRAYQQYLGEEYGTVVKIHGLLGSNALYISDSRILQHIFRESSKYVHAPWVISSHTVFFGPGLLATEGAHHRTQRKLLNPVFTSNVMRDLTPLMFRVAYELRDAIMEQLGGAEQDLDMMKWMGHAALEVIGRAGMDYSFVSFSNGATLTGNVGEAIKNFVPAIFALTGFRLGADTIEKWTTARFRRWIAPKVPSRRFQAAKYCVQTLHETAKVIYEATKSSFESGGQDISKQKLDIMSILLRANMTEEAGDRLSDEELIAQVRSFIFAATDTTSNVLCRILHTLAEHPVAQAKLREEIQTARRAHGTEVPFDTLNDLAYLDAVCRETLRLYLPVHFALRQTAEDVVMPLPVPLLGQDRSQLDKVVVPRGTQIILNFLGSNQSKAIWGEDAMEWKPERWAALPQSVLEARVPGVIPHLMSFGGGLHSCIGYRFALLEIKTTLFVLIDGLKMSLSGHNIYWNYGPINFPSTGENDTEPIMMLRAGPSQ